MVFSHAIIFFNPASTHAAAGRRRIGELKAILGGDSVEVIETESGGRKANAALVKKHAYKLDENTLLGIVAGDGTTNQIIEALLTGDIPARSRKAVILPLWGGNANDLAHMLNGPAYRAKLKDILAKGQVVPIHALQCEMIAKDKTKKTRLAACYASFGVSGMVAHRINQSDHRKHPLHSIPGGRLLLEIITVLSTIVAAPPISLRDAGKTKVMYELSIYNGSRMAKVERLPAKLNEELFYFNMFEDKKLLSALPRFINFARKRVSQNLLRSYASFTTKEESWAQFDGEPVKLTANTHVQVQLSREPFYALSTTLNNPDKKHKTT
jgi:diacylglycerol kinase family enzyme